MDEQLKRKAQKLLDNKGNEFLTQLEATLDVVDSLKEVTEAIKSIPETIIPEYPEIPEPLSEVAITNLPEVQKVEVTNFPEQKAPIVNVEASKAPIVNVSPVVEMNNEEVVSELKNIITLLSKDDKESVEQTQIVDDKGELVDFAKLFKNLSEKVGNIRVGGGSSLAKNLLNQQGTIINPATEEKQDAIISAIANAPAPVGGATETTLSQVQDNSFWLKSLIRLLKPLSIVTGGGSNRLSVDINNVTGGTIGTVTTVTTVGSVTNQANIGNVSAFTMQQSLLRNAFANGIRGNLTF